MERWRASVSAPDLAKCERASLFPVPNDPAEDGGAAMRSGFRKRSMIRTLAGGSRNRPRTGVTSAVRSARAAAPRSTRRCAPAGLGQATRADCDTAPRHSREALHSVPASAGSSARSPRKLLLGTYVGKGMHCEPRNRGAARKDRSRNRYAAVAVRRRCSA